MMKDILKRLLDAKALSPSLIRRGLEKENLRLDKFGRLSSMPHPNALGSKQTHPHITTDFAEAQLEIVSAVHDSVDSLYAEFESLYAFIHSRLDDELLWPYSMPCMTQSDEIAPAYYGENNAAKMKQVYRQGLILRYGKAMQIICGIHYNFSLDSKVFAALKKHDQSPLSLKDYISMRYMGLIRNYLRNLWLLPYLLGATPLVMKSSLPESIPDCLKNWDKQAYYAPFATSLRMSRIGYQNSNQYALKICHNTIEAYGKSLLAATQMPYEQFLKLGMKDSKGQYQQLNGSVLQIENEYYSAIRPKRISHNGERPAVALLNQGVEYIEVRVSDLNPMLPLGFDKLQLKFLEVFLLTCLLETSPDFVDGEMPMLRQNFNLVATQGRKPNLELNTLEGSKRFQHLAEALFANMRDVAKALDQEQQSGYEAALNSQYEKLQRVSLLPSEAIMDALQESGLSLSDFMLQQAREHKQIFMKPLGSKMQEHYEKEVQDSLTAWQRLESEKTINFDEYLAQYFNQHT